MMASAPEILEIEKTIADFIKDVSCSSMEFPNMTAAQRKHVKAALEKYPELTSESYGFGKDRKLHLFKKASCTNSSTTINDIISSDATSLVNVKNTFIDDWASAESEPCLMRSVPAYLPTSAMQCVMDGPVCKLDLCSIRETDCSTVAPSSCASDDGSPPATARGSLPDWFRLPPGLELEVQNTFVHFVEPSADERIVQSMPHSMFKKCLLESLDAQSVKQPAGEALADQEDKTCAIEDGLLMVGAEVIIEGLSKCPAFNGLTGTVQSFDVQTGRYSILLSCSEGKVAMLKRENCRLLPLQVGTEVVINGLSKCPAFNGLQGTVQSFDTQSGRYKVLLMSSEFEGKTAMLKRDNCELVSLAAGMEVVIKGLSKYPAFNGTRGTVQSFEAQSGRYNIILSSPVDGCKSSKVKRENLRLASWHWVC